MCVHVSVCNAVISEKTGPVCFYLREVHVLWAWEGLQRPVDEAVEEDEAGTASPNQQDGDEGNAQIIDDLK